MAYYITSAGFEIECAEFENASLSFYLQRFGLGHYIQLFLYEEIDLYCITIMETRHMDEMSMTDLEKTYMHELKYVYNQVLMERNCREEVTYTRSLQSFGSF